ncbi:MAG: carboxymuconolactone decarboxylase family protein [Solirubrobacteraceae bacterium]
MDPAEQLLRRLALNDERAVDVVLGSGAGVSRADVRPGMSPKVDLLIRLGALVALGAATPSLRRTVELARGAGATEEEIVGVLVAVAPTVGLARVVSAAPKLALAIGYDTDREDD